MLRTPPAIIRVTSKQEQHRGDTISLCSRRQRLGGSGFTNESSRGRQKRTVNAHENGDRGEAVGLRRCFSGVGERQVLNEF